MSRFCLRLTLLAAIVAIATAPSYALKLLSPTQDQVVRERVKISIPEKDLPADFVTAKGEVAPQSLRPFVSISIGGDGGPDKLVAAISADACSAKDGVITFYWDSKASYRDPNAANARNVFYKDGRYTLKVQVYDSQGKEGDSASVPIELKNKVDHRDLAVQLVNSLVFGESHAYAVHADVQVFQVVSGTYLPILGGMGMTSNCKIVQSVEDKRPDGSYLLRCRMGDGFLGSFGQKIPLFAIGEPKPQLYRIVDRFGNVVNRNVFSRQGKYSIMDVLPVLPGKAVKEGDSWPTQFDLKVEGITGVISLTGVSQLDSFEWQDGHQCAKIISSLDGSSVIVMDNGRIRSSSDRVHADVTTYFAYGSGRMLRREVSLEFPAAVKPGAGQLEGSAFANAQSSGGTGITSVSTMTSSEGGEDETTKSGPATPTYHMFGGPPPPSTPGSGASSGSAAAGEGLTKNGSVEIKLVVQLEK